MDNLIGQAINIRPGGAFANIGADKLSIGGIISGLITLVLIVAAVVFFFMLIIGGLKWILSGGDKAQTESARNQITAALIGLVVVFAAFAIAQVVGGLFGVDIFNFTLPNFQSAAGGAAGT